jgi:hypothetical protein
MLSKTLAEMDDVAVDKLRLLIVTGSKRSGLPIGLSHGFYRIIRKDNQITLKCVSQEIRGQTAYLFLLTALCSLYWAYAIQASSFARLWNSGTANLHFMLLDALLITYTLLLIYIWRIRLVTWLREKAPPQLQSLFDGSQSVVVAGDSLYIVMPEFVSQHVDEDLSRYSRRLRAILSWSINWMRILAPFEMLSMILLVAIASVIFADDKFTSGSSVLMWVIGAIGFVLAVIFINAPSVTHSVISLVRVVIQRSTAKKPE